VRQLNEDQVKYLVKSNERYMWNIFKGEVIMLVIKVLSYHDAAVAYAVSFHGLTCKTLLSSVLFLQQLIRN
jgi:hypothetical protein